MTSLAPCFTDPLTSSTPINAVVNEQLSDGATTTPPSSSSSLIIIQEDSIGIEGIGGHHQLRNDSDLSIDCDERLFTPLPLGKGNKRRSRSKSKSRSRSPRADNSSGGDNCEGGLAIKSDPDLCEEELDHHSSSTEGPDSQTSAASSPTFQQVMIPAYPEEDVDAASNSGILDEEDDLRSNMEEVLLPQFYVRFTNDVLKDGEVTKYKIRVGKPDKAVVSDDSPSSTGQPATTRTLERQYEDFEWLHHNLVVNNNVQGLIVPPLPERHVAVDLKEAESRAKKQLGSGFKNIQGDDFGRDAASLNRFMQQLLHHPVFGHDKHLVEFLEHENPPPRAKLKKSGWSALVNKTLESSGLKRGGTGVNDEDFFVKERDWAALYHIHINDTRDKYQQVVSAKLKTSNQITHLSTLLKASVGGREGTHGVYNKLNSIFGSSLEGDRQALDSSVRGSEDSLGNYFNNWCPYVEEENNMLNRRLTLLSETDAAAKALARATLSGKPSKTTAALQAKEQKDGELTKATTLGEQEIRRFHQQRLSEMKESLINYAKFQVESARVAKEQLAKSVSIIRSLSLVASSPEMSENYSKRQASKLQDPVSNSGLEAMHIPE